MYKPVTRRCCGSHQNVFSQSGPTGILRGAFGLLRPWPLSILAGEFHHANLPLSLFFSGAGPPTDLRRGCFGRTSARREAARARQSRIRPRRRPCQRAQRVVLPRTRDPRDAVRRISSTGLSVEAAAAGATCCGPRGGRTDLAVVRLMGTARPHAAGVRCDRQRHAGLSPGGGSRDCHRHRSRGPHRQHGLYRWSAERNLEVDECRQQLGQQRDVDSRDRRSGYAVDRSDCDPAGQYRPGKDGDSCRHRGGEQLRRLLFRARHSALHQCRQYVDSDSHGQWRRALVQWLWVGRAWLSTQPADKRTQ